MPDGSHLLAGKVRHVILPSLPLPTAPDAPMLRRVRLPQGELAQLHNSPDPIRYLASIELLEGAVRGNHYHHVKLETVYILAGKVRLTLLDLDTSERAVAELESGHLVTIPPRIVHALRPLSPGWAVEFAPDPLDPADTVKYALDPV